MRTLKGMFGFVFFLGLACVAALGGQDPKIEVEAWEVRINLRQPPEKVMAAIGRTGFKSLFMGSAIMVVQT